MTAFLDSCSFSISNTPGTSGGFTFSAKVAGAHLTPTEAGAVNGEGYRLFIYEPSNGNLEIRGGCTYNSGTGAFSRGTLRRSTSGSAINFTSAAIVSVIGPDAVAIAALEGFSGAWGALGGENAITGTATALIGRLNVCSGTAADYTVTLPAVSGNAGRYIGFRMAAGLTRIVTLDGNASELIDTNPTFPMLARDSILLYCNGTGWQTATEALSGVTTIVRNDGVTTQTLATNASTKIAAALTTVIADPLAEWNTSTKRFTPKRAGRYDITVACQNDSSTILAAEVWKNGSRVAQGASSAASAYQQAYSRFIVTANGSSDYFEPYCFSNTATTTNAFADAVQFVATYLGRA
jgi:hypothetical protein